MANDQYDFSDFDEAPQVAADDSGFDFSDFSEKAATAPIDPSKSTATPMTVNNPVEDISKTESAVRGGIQGLTLDFGDEIEAAARTPFQSKTSLTDLQSIADEYRRLRGDIRQEYKAAQEANPLSYTAGNIGGSLVVPGGGAKLLGKGALVLGGQILGSSEADLTKAIDDPNALGGELGQLGKEAGVTSSIALAAESALPVAGKIVKGVNKAVGNPLEDLFKAYKQSAAGRNIFGEEARRAAEKQSQEVSNDLASTLFSKGQKMGQQQSEILKGASDTKVDLYPELQSFANELRKLRETESIDPRFLADDQKMQEILQNISAKKGFKDLPPAEVNNIVKKLKDMSGISDTSLLKSPEAEKALQGFERGIREQNYSAVPGLREQNKSISDYNSLLEGLGLNKIRDAQYDPALKTQMSNKIQNMVRGIERESEQGIRARQSFEKLQPELSQDQIIRTQDASDYYDITKKAGGQSLLDKGEIATGTIIGKADRLLSMPTRALEGMSQTARDRGYNGLADGLQKVATEKNARARKALIFSLQQNPAYRQLLNEMNPEQEGDNEY